MRKSKIVKFFLALLFALICSFFISGLLRTLIEKKTNVSENMLDYKGTYNFILETTYQNQLVVLILSIFVLIFVYSKMNQKPKKYEDASDFGVHGTARWGKFEEIINNIALSKKNKYKPRNPIDAFKVERGLVLGKVPEKNELLILPKDTSVDNRNVLVVGSSGSGKGQSFVLPNLINNTEETMIVTDPKGELHDLTSEIKRDQGYKVYQIDFVNFEIGGYNPLDYVQDDQDAQQIAKTIAKNSAKDGKEDFFQVEGQRLLTALIIYCVYESKKKGFKANIPDHVFTMFNKLSKDEDFLENLLEDMDRTHPAYQQLQSATVAQGKTRSSILASFTQQTGIFAINKVANMTRESTFNFKEFQEHKSILYVKLPMDENPFLSLTATFFDQLINVFYRMADKNNSHLKIPTIFLLDEFANIGKIDKYARVLATCRGLGMGMSTIVQDFAQLEELYGKELTRSIISNHDTSIFLRTRDRETAKYFSDLADSTTARMKTDSASTTGGVFSKNYSTSKSNQEQYVKRELIPVGDLTTISKDRSYVFIAGYYPFKTEKPWQFEIYDDLLGDYSKYRTRLIKEHSDVFLPVMEEPTVIDELPSEDDSIVVVEETENIDTEETSSQENEGTNLPEYDRETGEVIQTETKVEITDQYAEITQEDENEDFTLDDLDNLLNENYRQQEQIMNESLDALEREEMLFEHADKIQELFADEEKLEEINDIFTEETKELDESINEDKEELLPM